MISVSSRDWRVLVPETLSGWAWNVRRIQFFLKNNQEISEVGATVTSSGSAVDDNGKVMPSYQIGNVQVNDLSFWGGRQDPATNMLWIQAHFEKPVSLKSVRLEQVGIPHFAQVLHIQYRNLENDDSNHTNSGSEWQTLASFKDIKSPTLVLDVACPTAPLNHDLIGVAHNLISKPSQECARYRLSNLCKPECLMPPRSTEFVPDDSFYNSINCEGLWVCTSKQVPESVLKKAAAFVRSWIPRPLRELFGRFRSVVGCADPGPMRLIILDHQTNQRAGNIPELNNDAPGRNGTACPFVFSSREDFEDGVTSWRIGALTGHEIIHGADMVIRQLVDPYFHVLVQDAYDKSASRGVFSDLYAGANRDEYLAETHIISLGIAASPYRRAGFKSHQDLAEKDEVIAEILKRYFRGSHAHQIETVEEYIEHCTRGRASKHDELTKVPDELIAEQLRINEGLRHKHEALDAESSNEVQSDSVLSLESNAQPNDWKVSSEYRVLAQTESGWAWDLKQVLLIPVDPSEWKVNNILCSEYVREEDGNVMQCYAPSNCFRNDESWWGGRQDPNGDIWIGVHLEKEAHIQSARVVQNPNEHSATKAQLQAKYNGEWQTLAILTRAPE